MRIWSLHPKYLDTKGLVALWRETLLAKHVLEGKTKGYKNHPQLNRFKMTNRPLDAINQYLSVVYQEAVSRAYNFDKDKIDWTFRPKVLNVTSGQVDYERKYLLAKLEERDLNRHQELVHLKNWDLHPLFKMIEGEIEDWELIKP